MFRVAGLGETRLKLDPFKYFLCRLPLQLACSSNFGALGSALFQLHVGDFLPQELKYLGTVPCLASTGNYCLCHDNEYMLYL